MNMRKKCYIYTRVSTAAQVDGFSLEAQQGRLYEYADFKDLEIVGEYCDAGRSGKSIKGRPEFQKMMDDVIRQKDNVSFVLVFKLSRFGRSAADVLKSMQLLMDYGVDLVSVDDSIDSSTQGGRLTLAILSAVAEIERDNITDQFMAGKMQRVREGKWSGGPAPYGYRIVEKELVMDPYEADIVRKIFDLYMQDGMLATTVARYLNDHGYRKEENSGEEQCPFTYDFVVNVLDNPVYCGKIVYGRRTNRRGNDGRLVKPDPEKQISVSGQHKAILTEKEWEAVQKKRKQFSGWSNHVIDPERISLLSGLVKCPVCGRGMIACKNGKINKNHGGRYKTLYYYECPGKRKQNGVTCTFKHIYNQEKIDSSVFEIIQGLAALPAFKNAVAKCLFDQETTDDLEEQLKSQRKELRREELNNRKLGEQLDGLDIFSESYEQDFDRIQKEIDEGYERMARIEENISALSNRLENIRKGFKTSENIEKMLNSFQKLYERMSCQERREMYRLFIERIDVLPETRKDGKVLKSISFRFSSEYGDGGMTSERSINGDICFTLDCTELQLTKAEAKATYAELKKYILDTSGLKVSSLYIAQIKRKYGIDMGTNYNKAADPKARVPICPEAKEKAIIDALKHFRMLDSSVKMKTKNEVNANGK